MAIFSDLNLGLFNQSQEILYDEDALKQQFLLMFTTRKLSRVKSRGVYSSLEDKLFEPVDDVTSEDIRQELISIASADYRIQLRSSEVLPDRENQQFYVSLDMYCPALKKEFNMNFNLVSKA